jgi:hypothetical protein
MNLLMPRRKCVFVSFLVLLSVAHGHAAGQPPPSAAPEAARAIDVRVVARKPEGGVRTVRVERGDTIVLRVRSDEKLSVHVHGYDVHVDVTPAAPASVTFAARWVGRFPVAAHLAPASAGRHGPEPTLLYLEVLPE